MKTVLQKMLEDVEYAEKLPNISPLTLQIYSSIKNMIIRGIPLEKQQIIDAFKSGEIGIYIDGKDYYDGYYE